MDITDFAGITIIGSLLSLSLESIKKLWGSDTFASRTAIIVLSVVFGGLYFLVRGTAWWATALGILASASTFYSLILKK